MPDNKTLPPEEPQNLAEWFWRLREYENEIFVRQLRDGKYETLSLTELTPEEWGEKVAGFLNKGLLPVRIRRENL